MIRIENIGKVFNARSRNRNAVLKDVSFELPDKGLVAIFGKSGSGKTTLLNIIGGLDKQDKGKIYIDGENVAGKVDKIRNAKIGFIFQNYYLERGYTIAEIMRNAMHIAGFKDEEEIKRRTEEVLTLVDMERFKNKQGDALSGGQKQRVAIARALIKGADIILADEPTGNLDAENTMKVMDILKEISKTKLVVLVTHEVTLIKKYADSHIKLVDGQLQPDSAIEDEIVYNTEQNNIYVDGSAREMSADELNIELYGEPITEKDTIQIINDNGNVYIKPGRNVVVLDDRSEKKLIFQGAQDAEEEPLLRTQEDIATSFTKSTAKRNGRLFTFKSIFKAFKGDGEERAYSTANIFKQVFIVAMAVIMCFFSFFAFEALNTRIENKSLNENSVYTNLNVYSELRSLDTSLYDEIDFFETDRREGSFSYSNLASLAGITAEYTPRALGSDATAESIFLEYGTMPQDGEVLISRSLAETLKNELRLDELNNDRSITLMYFDDDYRISGIVGGDEPLVFLNKVDYINFLGVYDLIGFTTAFFDSSPVFFDSDFVTDDGTTVSQFSAEIVASDTVSLADNQVEIEINRNALYNMMTDATQADRKVQQANNRLASATTAVYITGSRPMYVKSFSITKSAMTTDIRIHVNQNVLDNIFAYIAPNLDAIGSDSSSCYFEISTNGGEQLASLNARLTERGVTSVNIQAIYDSQNDEIISQAIGNLAIFIAVGVLMYLIYYFIEKSGSVKSSKEYGIYRAIGVNRSNLLFKETATACVANLITYLVCFLITLILMCVRYSIMNVAVGSFVALSFGVFVVSALIMIGVALIPYLFVLWQTPAKILAKYDI